MSIHTHSVYNHRLLSTVAAKLRARLTHRPALYDPRTGLPNRALLGDRLNQEVARARRQGGMVAVLRLDLDSVREIKATLGHSVGEQWLRGMSRRLADAVRATDTLARLDGDELVLVQPQLRHVAEAVALATKLQSICDAPFDLAGQDVLSTLSVGVALFPQDGHDADTLLTHADLALYRAKSKGVNQIGFFERGMDEEAQVRRQLDRELRQALERGEFVLHYQPQIELKTGRFTGAEALIRWNHPERGLVMPGAFIAAAEANGLIRPLGEWVLREACRQACVWRQSGWNVSVAVNLSPAQMRRGQFLPAIDDALSRVGLDPARLELEITEGVLMEDFERGGDGFMHGVTAYGVRLALDDFGTGYSSLAYLKHLPVKTIKIDRSFVRDLGEDPDADALVQAIVMLGHSLRKRVVAEGVEKAVQLERLRSLGCDETQGFFIARPQEAAAVGRLFAAQRYSYETRMTLPKQEAA